MRLRSRSMTTAPPAIPARAGKLRLFYATLYLAVVAGLGFQLASYYQPGFGFTALLGVGEGTGADANWGEDWGVSVYHHDRAPGYDAQYYAQLALDPLLLEEGDRASIDNVPYRARRVLLPLTAFVVGGGHPPAILQVYSLLNVACWLALGVVLLRWFPPVDLDRVLRWVGLMIATGSLLSIQLALVDGPSLLLLALALRAFERGRPGRAALWLSAAGLAKETNLLTAAVFWPGRHAPRRAWVVAAGRAALVALPLLGWVASIHLRLGDVGGAVGGRNFDWPGAGLIGRIQELAMTRAAGDVMPVYWWASVATLVALLVQAGFLLCRWREESAAWRLTVPFALLLFLIGDAVWEGIPGAADRVLLPLLLGFNLVLPKGRRWWWLLVLGNLSAVFGPLTFRPLPEPVVAVSIARAAADEAEVTVEFPSPWYPLEAHQGRSWRWAAEDAEIVVQNPYPSPLRVWLRGTWSAIDDRVLTLWAGEQKLVEQAVGRRSRDWASESFLLPPGETRLRLQSDVPGRQMRAEGGRTLAVMLQQLRLEGEVVPEPAGEP